MISKIRIGSPGKFDPTFGLEKYDHPWLCGPLYRIVWLDTGKKIVGIGSFYDPICAENYVKANREKLMDKEFEEILLVNE